MSVADGSSGLSILDSCMNRYFEDVLEHYTYRKTDAKHLSCFKCSKSEGTSAVLAWICSKKKCLSKNVVEKMFVEFTSERAIPPAQT